MRKFTTIILLCFAASLLAQEQKKINLNLPNNFHKAGGFFIAGSVTAIIGSTLLLDANNYGTTTKGPIEDAKAIKSLNNTAYCFFAATGIFYAVAGIELANTPFTISETARIYIQPAGAMLCMKF